jgi:hypothetical protein
MGGGGGRGAIGGTQLLGGTSDIDRFNQRPTLMARLSLSFLRILLEFEGDSSENIEFAEQREGGELAERETATERLQ